MSVPTDQEIADAIRQSAVEPESASVDGQSVKARSAEDLIRLRNDAANQAALASGRGGWGRVVRNRFVPQGGGPE